MANDDVLIVGQLDSKELERSIDALVWYVNESSKDMAEKFDAAMVKMKASMKDFALTQKVSVDLMKDAWRDMSRSFDAMYMAQKEASEDKKGGGGKTKTKYDDGTVGQAEELIRLEERRRKEMKLNSDELRKQNELIELQKLQLKSQTTSDTTKTAINARKELQAAFSMPARELTDAEKKLQRLQSLAARFQGKGILDEAQWNRLQTQIQNAKAKIETLRTKKPMSMADVMGMSESSIDAITAKMAALKRVTIDPKDAQQVKSLGDEYQRLKRRLAELQGQNIQATHSNNYLAQSFGYIRNRIVYALTLGALTNFVKQIYEVRAQYELLERSLGVLVGSFERGSQVFQELNEMSLKSPFTLMELAGAAKQLTAYDFAAKDVVDTTRRLADISAALGVPMERLTYNLGQIRAQTVLTARDARDFANAGLPIVSKLAERFTELEGNIVTTGDVYDRMKKKMVSYTDVMAVLNKMTDEGGKFFDFQAKQAETLRVQLANLTLAWNNMLNDLGKDNQSLLSMPVAGLKELLKNWRTFDRLIKSAVISLTIFKTIQLASMSTTPVTRFGQALQAALGDKTLAGFGKLGAGLKAIGTQLKALALNPWTWVFAGIMALVDLERQMSASRDAMHELNQEIRNNAKEASDSMLSFINNKGNQQTLALAKQNKLSAQEGEKAWQSIQEQIEQSALSCNSLIGRLLAIDDINERVATGFDYSKSIQKAQAALQDLQDDTIKITQDVGWFGMFGEGMVSDLKDYANYIEKYSQIAKEYNLAGEEANKWIQSVEVVKGARGEFLSELGKTAEAINNFISAYNITDPIQINEILERVKSQIKAKNPEIQGEMAQIFDIELDKKMATLTKGAVDENASLWGMFMDRLRSHSSEAFQGITNEWVKRSGELNDTQQKAVDDNLEYFKNTMPYAYDAVAKMVSDASQLKIHIGIVFNAQQVSDFQNEVKKRINNAKTGILDFGGEAFLPTNNDNLESWVDTQQKAIKGLRGEIKLYERDNSEWAKKQIEDNNKEIAQRKNLLDLFNQQYEKEKKSGKGKGGRSGGRKSEDIVAEALRQEIQLIKEMQSNYDKLRKSGVSNMEAIELASKGYEMTILRINNILQKYGINKFNATDFAGKNVHTLLDSLKRQREELLVSGKVKTSSLQSLDVEIQKLSIDARTYDMKKITDGLNNELSKVKEEYELGIELDANPEMGEVFADMMGLSKEQLADMPRDFQGVLRKMQTLINNELGSGKFNLEENLNKSVFERWVNEQGQDLDSEQVKALKNYVDYANKVRRDETKTQIQEWDKLLEKYSEYEYKMKKIQEEAQREREIAIKKGASQDILNAINRREREQKAQLAFEEFQKSPQWIQATGDLAMLSKQAVNMLIGELENYKKHAGDLNVKQIKQLNNALNKLYKEQRKNNPFHAISDMISEAKQRAEEYNDAINKVASEISYLSWKDVTEGLTSEQEEKLAKLRESWVKLKNAQDNAGQIDATQWVSSINTTIAAVKQGVGVFNDLAKAIGGVNTNDVDKVFSVIEKGGEGAATGAQIGGGYGAIIGAAAGVITGLVTTFSGLGDQRITKSVKESETAVKRLETAYKELEDAIEHAYGTEELGLKRIAIANKEAQLAELKRQLALEKSRKEKNKDNDKIADLRDEISSLQMEIKNASEEIVNDLLNISTVGDAAEQLVSSMIDAFKQGEDYMKQYSDSFENMIDNMIMKSIVSEVIGGKLQSFWDELNAKTETRGEPFAAKLEKYQEKLSKINDAIDKLSITESQIGGAFGNSTEVVKYKELMERKKDIEKLIDEASQKYAEAITPTPEDVELLRGKVGGWRDEVKAMFDAYMEAFGIRYGQNAEQELSSLQQGIQGITESTANAIEAYMNGMSQQVYLQSTLLTQIRDAVVQFDIDVQVATMSQILLQLQASYQAQMVIQSTLTGWSTPSGMAVRVELTD